MSRGLVVFELALVVEVGAADWTVGVLVVAVRVILGEESVEDTHDVTVS